MKQLKIVAIDDNNEFLKEMKKFFHSIQELNLIMATTSGKEGLMYLKKEKEKINFLILDLVMNQVDGISILEEIQKERLPINTIVLSAFNNEEMIQRASNLGADYYITKPIDWNKLKEIIIKISKEKNNNKRVNLGERKLELRINEFLHELGIPSHLKGYQYLKEAIILKIKKEIPIMNLYQILSKEHHQSIKSIEKNIRKAIEIGWIRGNIEFIDELFGYSIDIEKDHTSNNIFINTISERIKLETY